MPLRGHHDVLLTTTARKQMKIEQTKRGVVISEQVMLASVHIHQGSKKITDHEAGAKLANGSGADSDLVTVSTSLLGKAFPRSTSIANLIYATHKKWTFRMPSNSGGQMKGPAVLATRLAEQYVAEMTSLIDEFNTTADEECEALPAFIAREQHRLGHLFKREAYPASPEAIRHRFGATFHLDGLPRVDDINAGVHTASQQAQAQARQDEIVSDMGKQILVKMLEHVSHLANVLSKDKAKIFPSLFDNVTDLIEVIVPCCNIAGDPEIESIAKDLKAVMRYNADQVKGTESAKAHVAKGASRVAKKLGQVVKDRGVAKSDLSKTVQSKVKAYF